MTGLVGMSLNVSWRLIAARGRDEEQLAIQLWLSRIRRIDPDDSLFLLNLFAGKATRDWQKSKP